MVAGFVVAGVAGLIPELTGGFGAGLPAGLAVGLAGGLVRAGAGGFVAGGFAAGELAAVWAAADGAASPEKCSSSLPWIAAFMKVIQMGRAALAPVSFSPRDWRLSNPTQTPQVTEGEKPRNQASV